MKSAVGSVVILFSVVLCFTDGFFMENCDYGETWRQGCDVCFCPKSGMTMYGTCTRRKCGLDNKVIYKESGCTLGVSKMRDCNKCICSVVGETTEFVCEMSACDGGLREEIELEPAQASAMDLKWDIFENATHCTPGTQFYLGCNPCYCQSSGIKSGSRCDNDGCPPFPPKYKESSICDPRSYFKQDCNTCVCGTSGYVGDARCTTFPCTHFHP